LIFAFTVLLLGNVQAQVSKNKKIMENQTIYQFKVKDLSGKEFDFASLKGKKL